MPILRPGHVARTLIMVLTCTLTPSLLMAMATTNPRTSSFNQASGKTTDFMHARYFSPNLGRFVSVDPVGGSVGSSQSWNRYSYVENNPIGFVDPRGEASLGAMTSWIEADPAGYHRAGRKSFYSLMLAGSEAQYGFYPSFALSGSTAAEGLKNMFGAGIRGLDWFSIDIHDLQRSDGTSLISVDFTSSWLAGFGASAEFESRGFLISSPKNIYLNWLWLKTDFGLGGKPNVLDAGARVGPVGGNFSLNLDSVLAPFFENSMFSSFEDTESRFESKFGSGDCGGNTDCWLSEKKKEMGAARSE